MADHLLLESGTDRLATEALDLLTTEETFGDAALVLTVPSASGAGTVANAGANGAASITLSLPSATADGTVLIQGAGATQIATIVAGGSGLVQGSAPAPTVDLNVQQPYGSLWNHPY